MGYYSRYPYRNKEKTKHYLCIYINKTMNNTNLILRLSEELKNSFADKCTKENKAQSEVLRGLIKMYIQNDSVYTKETKNVYTKPKKENNVYTQSEEKRTKIETKTIAQILAEKRTKKKGS